MTDTTTWAWVGNTPMPDFSTASQNNLNGHWNGTAINPNTAAPITWSDRNTDGVFHDNESGDGSSAGQDRVVIGGSQKVIHEVAVYQNSTMTIAGQVYQVTMVAWVFTDGTSMMRIPDSQIPPGFHHDDVTGLRLGTWDQREYSANDRSGCDDQFVCFAAGTLIDTADGSRAVETLVPGQRVCTADHGDQPLRWVGQRSVSGLGKMAPICFAAGALGNLRDLYVSPQHRMLISGWRAELWFGEVEVLVPAAALINDRTIRRAPRHSVTYCQLLFDRHEIIYAEGAPSESFHPVTLGLNVADPAQRDAVPAFFPDPGAEHRTAAPCAYSPAARPSLRMSEARVLRD